MNDFSVKKYFIGGGIVVLFVTYLIRLFYIQVIDVSYKISAENNSQRHEIQMPARGKIYDRDSILMAYNEVAFDIKVLPRQIKPFDTILFCKILDLSLDKFKADLKKACTQNKYKSTIIAKQISTKKHAILQEMLYKFPGFFVDTRTQRTYPINVGAHILGFIGDVTKEKIKSDDYYGINDEIGMNGIEKSYEKILRGTKGVRIYIVDVHGREQGSYKNGNHDDPAIVGSNIVTTIDAELQAYGEKLMKNKKGSIVAIEPSSGEILALVTSPSYDPNLLVGRGKERSKNYVKLLKDKHIPLWNRAIMAQYPPGSTFKLITALIGLQEEVLNPFTVLPCNGGYRVGNFYQACHHGPAVSFLHSIQSSCNAYYSITFRKILDNKKKYRTMKEGYSAWKNYLSKFSIGVKTGVDLPGESAGNVPDVSYFDKQYSNWSSLTVVSMAIGQGELGLTPLQLTNMTASISNRGYYYIPHIIKRSKENEEIDKKFLTKQYVGIDSKHFDDVIDGMELVVSSGTGTSAWIPGITVCGKTGTAQNPHGKNHSIFVAFAPKVNPQIAISVYVENAGQGAIWAAPISSLMIEKYIRKKTNRKYLEDYIINANLIDKK